MNTMFGFQCHSYEFVIFVVVVVVGGGGGGFHVQNIYQTKKSFVLLSLVSPFFACMSCASKLGTSTVELQWLEH